MPEGLKKYKPVDKNCTNCRGTGRYTSNETCGGFVVVKDCFCTKYLTEEYKEFIEQCLNKIDESLEKSNERN